ncbi:YegJ family protein [Flavobacterium reichenbachii]|uniref:YegJ family protein n=1 Tax=Flavobacterium reichenbachii TaxID=362418 RepID=UPI00068945C9|nr:DUF2314 domain-containing protein [Flavobacterium reichenbachii]OXB16261.1 hypothetical protein B0A68_08370 [Flavobacterium reichenbachii]
MKKITLILFVLFALTSCKNSDKIERKDQPDIYNVQKEDHEMNKAIAEAKKTLPEFYKALENNNPDYNAFAIKVRFDAGNDAEHMWINGLFKKNEDYFGIVDNLPEITQEVKQGDTIKINAAKVSDWMYLDKDELKGGYTIKLLRNRMSEDERIEFDKTSGMLIK